MSVRAEPVEARLPLGADRARILICTQRRTKGKRTCLIMVFFQIGAKHSGRSLGTSAEAVRCMLRPYLMFDCFRQLSFASLDATPLQTRCLPVPDVVEPQDGIALLFNGGPISCRSTAYRAPTDGRLLPKSQDLVMPPSHGFRLTDCP